MSTQIVLHPFSKQGFVQANTLLIMSLLLAVWLGSTVRGNATETGTTNLTQQILQMPTFREGLIYIGDKTPTEAEDKELLEVLNHLHEEWWTTGLEQFLKDYPNSPWAASLHYDYASFCRRTGRTTKALEHFEAGWTLAKNDTSLQGRRLSGAILANWTALLSSLGRLEELKNLVAIGDHWHFVNPQDRNKFQGAKNSYFLMQEHPEMAYRCGTFALKAVGGLMEPGNQALESLAEVPSPTNGFSMAGLVDLAKKYGLNLVAVRRTAGQDLILPSVVHWRQNHYAAILKRQGDLYLVSDPTFGTEKWMPAGVINGEASGEFLIPATLATNGWTQLARNEAVTIHGMGLPDNIKDGKDKGCKPGGPCPPCNGMPVWWVTEPYINLWMADEPLSYLTSRGEPFTFRITYKQRDTRPTPSDYLVSTAGWNNSWASYVRVDSTQPCYNTHGTGCMPGLAQSYATVYLPNGGEVDFNPGQNYDSETRLMLQQISGFSGDDDGHTGLRLIHADGSQDIYGFTIVIPVPYGDDSEGEFVLTRHIDPNGDTTWFQYDSNGSQYVLDFVLDPDGRTNFLTYSSKNLLLSVTNAYGQNAHFNYDASGNLTNILDAAGMSSSITYDANNNPTALITPYGTNYFLIVDNGSSGTNGGEGDFGGHNLIDRAVQVTDPVGANYLYLYRYDSSSDTPLNLPTSFPSGSVPTGPPLGTLDDGTGGTNFLTGVCYRNSFYWGPRQYAGLSTTVMTNFTANDYLRGRMRHWLEDTNQLDLTGYLSVEQDASPDGSTPGLLTFYDYQGKLPGYNFCAGAYALPSVKAWRLPNGETHYEYKIFDYFGNVTNDITTYTLPNGSAGTRTNQYIYADNTYNYDYVDVYYSTYTVPDLLTKVVGADGNTIWAYGGFDTVTWTNYFYILGDTQTNVATMTSSRVLPDYATNGVGQVVTTTFTSGGNPVTYCDMLQWVGMYTNYSYGTPIATTFPGYNKVTSITTPAGLTTTNIYDNNGFLAQTIDLQIGRTNSFGYTTDGLIGAFTNELGLNVGATWDNLLRLTSVQFPDSTYISNRYDRLDLGGTRDRLGNWTTYGHDGARHLTSITNANNAVTVLDWCGCGSLTDIYDPLFNHTSLYYDNQGNLTNVAFPDGSALFYQYDLAAQRVSAADGAGRTWLFGYNNQGLVTVVSNAYGRVQGTFYDIRDRQTNFTNADNVAVSNTFDPLDRILTRTWPNGATEGLGYSAAGLAFYTNQLQQVTRYGYDAAMRETSETNANLEVNLFTYDPASDLRTLTDGKSHTTTWTYDLFGNVSNKVDAASNLIFIYRYDAANRLTNRWTPAKANTYYKYDAVGNLTNIVYPVSSSIVLNYDPLNRLTNMVDAVGTTAFSYSQVGQLLSEDGPWANDTVSYTYAQRLRTALSLSQPSGSWSESYGYDSARRLTSVISLAGEFDYTPGGTSAASSLIKKLSLPNGAYITNSYDGLARLLSTELVNSSATILDAETYAYDAGNERTQQVFTAGNYINYGYEQIGQIKSAIGKESGGVSRLQEQLGYGYDAADNLNFRTNNALIQTFNVNNLNELTTITNGGTLTVAGTTTVPATSVTVNGLAANHYADATFSLGGFTVTNGNNTFTAVGVDTVGTAATNSVTVNLQLTNGFAYDLNGNLLTNGDEVLVWNDENELVTNLVANSWKSEFVYDGLMRRRIERDYSWNGSSWTQTNEIHFVYDGNVILQQRDANNTPTLTLTRGLDISGELQEAGGIGGLLAMTEGSSTSSYYHADGSGNTTCLINTNQLVVAKAEYEPDGGFLSLSGPMAYVNPYWYSSKPVHWQSGKYDFLYRWYVPDLDRFANRDPIQEWGGINLYSYADNNPINAVDLWGLTGECATLKAMLENLFSKIQRDSNIQRQFLNGQRAALTQLFIADRAFQTASFVAGSGAGVVVNEFRIAYSLRQVMYGEHLVVDLTRSGAVTVEGLSTTTTYATTLGGSAGAAASHLIGHAAVEGESQLAHTVFTRGVSEQLQTTVDELNAELNQDRMDAKFWMNMYHANCCK